MPKRTVKIPCQHFNTSLSQELLGQAKQGQFQFVVVQSVDRISRKREQFFEFVEQLNKYGVSVVVAVDSQSWLINAIQEYIRSIGK